MSKIALAALLLQVFSFSGSFLTEATESRSIQQENIVERISHTRLIIIGAGVSGIAAASRLMTNGFYDFIILEAENRIGGRIHTVSFAENVVDLGAEWVHGQKGNVVYEMAEQYNLLNTAATGSIPGQFVWSDGSIADKETIELLTNISITIRDSLSEKIGNFSGSYGEWFLDQFSQEMNNLGIHPHPELRDGFLNWFSKFTAFYDGADTWFNTSAQGLLQYKECPGNLGTTWKKGGYSQVLDLLTKRYPNEIDELPVRKRLMLKSEVSGIYWNNRAQNPDEPIIVQLSNGVRFSSDWVLVTTSLGVLKGSDMQFYPPLNDAKRHVIDNLGFGQVDKLFLYFSDPWWPKNFTGASMLVTAQDMSLFKERYPQYGSKGHWIQGLSGFYVDQHRPNVVLMDWIVGEEARNMEMYSDYQVMVACIRWLELFVGNNFTVPWPSAFASSKWWSNPHFRGSYSYRSMASQKANVHAEQLAESIRDADNNPIIFFAGEATHKEYYSTVHGAIESGWREADNILTRLVQTESKNQKPKPVDDDSV